LEIDKLTKSQQNLTSKNLDLKNSFKLCATKNGKKWWRSEIFTTLHCDIGKKSVGVINSGNQQIGKNSKLDKPKFGPEKFF
jgi:hypothetical protein